MPATAKLRHLRIAPRKVRLVADLVRGKKIERAQTILNFTAKKASKVLLKLLNQAAANAKNNLQLDPANLFISKIAVDEGPKLKRWRARSRGQAYEIQKKTSHITIILEEIKKTAKKIKKKKEEKPAVAVASAGEEKKEVKAEKPKFKPREEIKKPKAEKGKGGLRKMFRRKAF